MFSSSSSFPHTPLNLIKTQQKQITSSLLPVSQVLILVGISQTFLRTVWVVSLASGGFLEGYRRSFSTCVSIINCSHWKWLRSFTSCFWWYFIFWVLLCCILQWAFCLIVWVFFIFFKFFIFYSHLRTCWLILEGGEGREREGEKHWGERETLTGYLSHAPLTGDWTLDLSA